MFKKAALLLVASTSIIAASEGEHHWSYSGANGPAHWGETCAAGKHQSPVGIRTTSARVQKLPALAFDYKPTALHIVDNGHSVEVDVDKGSTLAVGGARFSLVQFHFHKPSEESVDGRRFTMDAHFVHRDADGNIAVVAVLLQNAAANPLIETLWRHLPHEKGRAVSPAGVTIDPGKLLPTNRSYFTYVGSLTTPPCTEGVRWFVLKTPAPISSSEVAAFGKLYPLNARPIQPTHGREILSSN